MSENNFKITRSNFIIFIIGCIAVSSLIISSTNIQKIDEISTPTIKYSGTDSDFKTWFKSPDGKKTIFNLLDETEAGTDLKSAIYGFTNNIDSQLAQMAALVEDNKQITYTAADIMSKTSDNSSWPNHNQARFSIAF